jgi:hypothetical protein
MEPTPLQLLKVRLQGFKRTLGSASERSKSEHISTELAKNFNSILANIGEKFPSIRDALPEPVPSTTLLRKAGKADISFLDLEILVDQAVGILDLLDSGE